MPIYDYRCDSCGYTFDQTSSIDDRDMPTHEPCPNCGNKTVKMAFLGVPAFLDPPTIGKKKPDREFRDLLGKIKKDHRGRGNIDRYT